MNCGTCGKTIVGVGETEQEKKAAQAKQAYEVRQAALDKLGSSNAFGKAAQTGLQAKMSSQGQMGEGSENPYEARFNVMVTERDRGALKAITSGGCKFDDPAVQEQCIKDLYATAIKAVCAIVSEGNYPMCNLIAGPLGTVAKFMVDNVAPIVGKIIFPFQLLWNTDEFNPAECVYFDANAAGRWTQLVDTMWKAWGESAIATGVAPNMAAIPAFNLSVGRIIAIGLATLPDDFRAWETPDVGRYPLPSQSEVEASKALFALHWEAARQQFPNLLLEPQSPETYAQVLYSPADALKLWLYLSPRGWGTFLPRRAEGEDWSGSDYMHGGFTIGMHNDPTPNVFSAGWDFGLPEYAVKFAGFPDDCNGDESCCNTFNDYVQRMFTYRDEALMAASAVVAGAITWKIAELGKSIQQAMWSGLARSQADSNAMWSGLARSQADSNAMWSGLARSQAQKSAKPNPAAAVVTLGATAGLGTLLWWGFTHWDWATRIQKQFKRLT